MASHVRRPVWHAHAAHTLQVSSSAPLVRGRFAICTSSQQQIAAISATVS